MGSAAGKPGWGAEVTHDVNTCPHQVFVGCTQPTGASRRRGAVWIRCFIPWRLGGDIDFFERNMGSAGDQ